MEIVAHHLQTKAASCLPTSLEFDLFGRSSFNRYYYAAYLQVRTLLGTMNRDWVMQSHANIPALLKGQVCKDIRRRLSRARRISDNESVSICFRAQTSAHDLANLMEQAYVTRVTADYSPEIIVVPDGQGRFQLNQVSIKTAHSWPGYAKTYGDSIRRAWILTSE